MGDISSIVRKGSMTGVRKQELVSSQKNRLQANYQNKTPFFFF